MTPRFCLTAHDPPHSYGDCLRACIASVMDRPAEDVPHFMDGGVDPHAALDAVRLWLKPQHCTAFLIQFPPVSRAELFEVMQRDNPEAVYLLEGITSDGGGHIVVCRGNKVIHNPAWFGCHITEPGPSGWVAWVIART